MNCPSRCTWILLALFSVTAAYARDSALRSPWDSYPITTNDAAFCCPAPAPLPHDFATNSYFTDGDGCRLELRARQNHLNGRGQQDSQPFGIKKEKKPILLDGPSHRSRPLIGDIERARIAECFRDPVGSVQHATIPKVLGVSVKFIPSRFCHVVHIRAWGISKMSRVAITHHSGFLDLVLTQKHTRSASKIKMTRVVVHAIQGEEI